MKRLLLLLFLASPVLAQNGAYSSPKLGGGSGVTSVTCTTGCSVATGTTTPAITVNGLVSGSNISANGVFNVKDPAYGAVGDAKMARNVVLTSLSAAITDATDTPWLSTDCHSGTGCTGPVDKKIYCIVNPNSVLTTPISTITSFTSTSSVGLSSVVLSGGGGTGICTWATQDDTTAIQAAVTAAKTVTGSINTNNGPVLGEPGTVFFPPGGYLVTAGLYCFIGSGGSPNLAPNFLGSGRQVSIIYPAAGFTPCSSATYPGGFISLSTTEGVVLGGMTIEGDLYSQPNFGGSQEFIHFSSNKFDIPGLEIQDVGTSGTYIINIAGQFGTITDLFVQNSPAGGQNIGCGLTNLAAATFVNPVCSNQCYNLYITNSGSRTPTGTPLTFNGGFIDENQCSQYSTQLLSGSSVNFTGTNFFASAATTAAIYVDGTSIAYLSQVGAGAYNTSNNLSALNIASGGQVFASQSTLRGNGTTAAIVGPAGAFYYDQGGNVLQNCTATVCANVTAAQQTTSTLGWSGGIQPIASLTHTPNTCYAAAGILAATQNLCTLLLDKNYQVVNITAQSGGNTPGNSSCSGAPVITLSDGTRTATLTLTTGKTAWSSAVDTATVNSIFASGATLTVSVGTFTCATPPVNISVNYDLQSVLNP